MKKIVKKNVKILIGFVLGIIVSGVVVYAATIKLSSSDVLYDNSKSGGSSSDVQGSLEELYQKTKDYKPCSSAVWEANNKYFTDAYIYNPSTCVTGDEDTCLRTDCYISSKKTCPVGTIIDYVVSGNSNKVRFHVMHDDGRLMTMQTQKNIVYNTPWYTVKDNTKGPLTILPRLEKATESWSNVEDQTYTMGTTIFKDNAYTGCSSFSSCTLNKYTLLSRTAKARMITLQEAVSLGCTGTNKSCPIWMNNYLYNSTSYGGTINDDYTENDNSYNWGSFDAHNWGYWTMSTSFDLTNAWHVNCYGHVTCSNNIMDPYYGARAVVVVSK